MPFPVAHGLVGTIVGILTKRRFAGFKDLRFVLICAGLAILPDIDFVFNWVFHLHGWHRGFTHSIAFGVAAGVLASLFVATPHLLDRIALVLAAVSHGLLDALTVTDKGTGITLLWPFSDYRFQFGLADYFPFLLNPRFDPFSDILIYALKVSFFEILILSPILVLLFILKQRAD